MKLLFPWYIGWVQTHQKVKKWNLILSSCKHIGLTLQLDIKLTILHLFILKKLLHFFYNESNTLQCRKFDISWEYILGNSKYAKNETQTFISLKNGKIMSCAKSYSENFKFYKKMKPKQLIQS